ncbi:MAG: hypothetical protein JJT95_11555 [Pararhodobacter sp.]|nr:hypothetical protein [Pararhodobacter sp.]
MSAQQVFAADGARGTFRRLCGLRLEGDNREGRNMIADVQMQHHYPTILLSSCKMNQLRR